MTFVHIFIVLQMSALSESPECLQSSLTQNSMKSVFFFWASEALSTLRFCLLGSPWRLHHASPPLVLWEGPSSYLLKTSEQGAAWGRGQEENHRCPASLGVSPCYKLSRIRFPSMSNLIFLEDLSTLYCPDPRAHTHGMCIYGCPLSQATGSGCFD